MHLYKYEFRIPRLRRLSRNRSFEKTLMSGAAVRDYLKHRAHDLESFLARLKPYPPKNWSRGEHSDSHNPDTQVLF